MCESELAGLLRHFFGQIGRAKDGERYGRSGLIGLRNGIARFLTSPPYNRNIDLTKGAAFKQMNQVHFLYKWMGNDVSFFMHD